MGSVAVSDVSFIHSLGLSPGRSRVRRENIPLAASLSMAQLAPLMVPTHHIVGADCFTSRHTSHDGGIRWSRRRGGSGSSKRTSRRWGCRRVGDVFVEYNVGGLVSIVRHFRRRGCGLRRRCGHAVSRAATIAHRRRASWRVSAATARATEAGAAAVLDRRRTALHLF